jgi:hypothetical protein
LHLNDGEVLKIPVILHSADNFIDGFFEQLIFGFFYGILAYCSTYLLAFGIFILLFRIAFVGLLQFAYRFMSL